ncbi:MAG: protein kinase [Gemmatimonadales bacterium]
MADLVARLRGALAERYTIERELGRGGMALVFLAHDLKHDRPVALKVLKPELAAVLGADRFLREIHLSARLQHTNILSLYDSGEAAGFLYYVMPYVEGKSLRDRLEREGQLPTADAIQITCDVAAALAHAHSHDVVHRDIKPENILLSGGHALVADFGIARAITTAGGDKLTETGLALGTPAYMSPEQAAADVRMDGRADLYALGCVLYEMLAGAPPFTGSSAQAVAARHSIDPVPPLRTVRKTVPPAMERVVLRALEKVPADRYATATEFIADLTACERASLPVRRWGAPAIGGSAAALGVLAVAGWLATSHGPEAGVKRSLAVLPCVKAGSDSTADYLSEGVTENLITGLAQTGNLEKVISSASARQYKNSAKPPAQIGAELGVNMLLFCRYGQAGNSDRLALQLVSAPDGSIRWADVYERDLSANRTILPSKLVTDVLAAAGVRLSPPERARIGREPTYDQIALNLNKEGQFFLNKYTQDGLQRSIVLFRQALERDSTLADAYVGLGYAYMNLGIAHGDLDSREAFPLVREAAQRALELDSASAGGHVLLGMYEWGYGWDWKRAKAELERAVEIDPGSAFGYNNLAFIYSALGRFDNAIRAATRATELDPLTPMMWADVGVQYYAGERYAEAVPKIDRALQLDPNGPPYHWAMGAVYVEAGEMSKGLDHLQRAVELSGGQEGFRGYVGYARGLMGDTAAAHAVLRRLDTSWRARPSGNTALAIALVHIGLNNRDQAFRWLDEAYRGRSSNLAFIATTAPGKRLASDPRYPVLLRRLNLSG